MNAVSGASVRVIDATSYNLAGQYSSTGNIRAIVSGYHFSFIGLQTGVVQYLDQSTVTPVFLDAASVPGPSPVAALALAQAGNLPLVVVGHGTGLAVFDYDAITSAPDEPPSIPRDLSLSAYPNPFNGVVTVTLAVPQSGTYQFTVFDNLGREVWNRALFATGTTAQKLDFSPFAAGHYVARLSGTSGTTALRLIYLP